MSQCQKYPHLHSRYVFVHVHLHTCVCVPWYLIEFGEYSPLEFYIAFTLDVNEYIESLAPGQAR